MNRKRHIAMGPGAASLILITVVLAMCVLGALTLISARNEHRLSTRSLEIAQVNYTLFDRSERTLASLAELVNSGDGWQAGLPEGVSADGDLLCWQESEGSRTLECEAEMTSQEGGTVLKWRVHRLCGETEEIWD